MKKISVTINTHLINKEKLVSRDYTNKEGNEVMVKELKLEIIPLKEPKIVREGNGWKLVKVAFVTQSPTLEEKTAKIQLPIIGDAVRFEESIKQPDFSKDSKGVTMKESTRTVSEDINPEDIPF